MEISIKIIFKNERMCKYNGNGIKKNNMKKIKLDTAVRNYILSTVNNEIFENFYYAAAKKMIKLDQIDLQFSHQNTCK